MSMNASTLLNCTPHAITIYDDKGENVITTFPSSGYVARLTSKPQEWVGSLQLDDGRVVPIYSPQVFQKEVEGLPPLEENQRLNIIVSLVVGEHLKAIPFWQGAVYGPDMGKDGVVRNEAGQILGTKRLVLYTN